MKYVKQFLELNKREIEDILDRIRTVNERIKSDRTVLQAGERSLLENAFKEAYTQLAENAHHFLRQKYLTILQEEELPPFQKRERNI